MSALQCEKFFRDLSSDISTDWQPIATQCEILSNTIKTINHDYSKVKEKSFQFLVLLRNKLPELLDWSGTLGKALRHENRNDLDGKLDNFIQKVTQEHAMDEDGLESQSSSASRTQKKGPHRGRTAKKSKRSLPNDGKENFAGTSCSSKKKGKPNHDKENLAGTACSSPRKTEKVKKEKPTFLPVQPTPGKLKLISDISKEGLLIKQFLYESME
ncbi:uncharacterized protein [Asterias amurensis]|uniref:uncharacterized protein isoform X1 n=1 Tax=Asterias amurensis TaxID=7602 RepID=UPI003AB8DF1B